MRSPLIRYNGVYREWGRFVVRRLLLWLGFRPLSEREALWQSAVSAREAARDAEEAMHWATERDVIEILALEIEVARRKHAYYTRLWREDSGRPGWLRELPKGMEG